MQPKEAAALHYIQDDRISACRKWYNNLFDPGKLDNEVNMDIWY